MNNCKKILIINKVNITNEYDNKKEFLIGKEFLKEEILIEEFLIEKEIEFDLSNMKSLEETRMLTNELIKKLQKVKVILAKEVIGIYYNLFIKNNIEVCEAIDFRKEVLEEIWSDYMQENKEKNINKEENNEDNENNEDKKDEYKDLEIKPYNIGKEDEYYIDYLKISQLRPEITSKKAILPFLGNQNYKKLTIKAAHMMPWISNIKEQFNNIEIEYNRFDGYCLIEIKNNNYSKTGC